MQPKRMLTDADILTITEIVSGCVETVMASISELKTDVAELKVDVKYLKKQVNKLNDGQDVIRADLVNVHRQLDYVEMTQADRVNNS